MRKSNIIHRIKEDFDLNGIPEVYFWKSEWEQFDVSDKLATVSIPYLIYRLLYMTYFIAVTTANMICSKSSLNLYFIYLTNLTFALQLIYSTLFFALTMWVKINRSKIESRLFGNTTVFTHQAPKLPLLNKIVWMLISVVNVIPYGVTLGYWAFLYADSGDSTQCESVNNYLVHAANSPLALIDMMIIAVPMRISHMVFPIICAILYVLFSLFYELGGGLYSPGKDNIYSILDWKNSPGIAALSSVLGLGFCVIGQIGLCWGISRLRVYIVTKCRT